MTVEENNEDPDGIESRVIETLIDLREERGWSQSELARKMVEAGWPKYTQMSVSRTEKGERPIRLNEVEALANVFGIEMFELWLPRKLRRYSMTQKDVEQRQAKLLKDVVQLLAQQEKLAMVADNVDLADTEIAYAYAVLSETPEVIVSKARASQHGATPSDLQYSDRFKPALQQAVEAKIWPAGNERPTSLQHFVEALDKGYRRNENGEHQEEA